MLLYRSSFHNSQNPQKSYFTAQGGQYVDVATFKVNGVLSLV